MNRLSLLLLGLTLAFSACDQTTSTEPVSFTDGPTDAAGAIVDDSTIKRAEALGLNYRRYLEANDAYHFFKHTGELLLTGPTNTNVMDMRVILVSGNQ